MKIPGLDILSVFTACSPLFPAGYTISYQVSPADFPMTFSIFPKLSRSQPGNLSLSLRDCYDNMSIIGVMISRKIWNLRKNATSCNISYNIISHIVYIYNIWISWEPHIVFDIYYILIYNLIISHIFVAPRRPPCLSFSPWPPSLPAWTLQC